MKSWTKFYFIFAAFVIFNVGCDDQQNYGQGKEEKPDQRESNGALTVVDSDDDDSSIADEAGDLDFSKDIKDVFQPTDKWQKVKTDQAIPAGLHVRLNMQTGEREAKLLDGDDTAQRSETDATNEPSHLQKMKMAMEEARQELESGKESVKTADLPDDLKYWKHADKEGMINMKNSYFTREELKEALKKFKVSRDDVQQPSQEEKGETGKKFRSIDEIRQQFKDLNIDMKSDLELLTEILNRYKLSEVSHDERLTLLTDLEYYLHQIDNAKNFADMGGLELVISDLNSTFEDIRSEAALVLSSAVQSNPAVQVAAIEAGTLQQLIRLLSTEPSMPCRSRLFAALSSLIRLFPFAQQKFVELGGLQTLTNILTRHSDGSGHEKLALKAVTLVNDLLTERLSVQNDTTTTDDVHQQRIHQYSQVPLFDSLVEHGWCELVPRLLVLPEHDSREKVLATMWTLRRACRREYIGHLTALQSLHAEYVNLSVEESRDAASDDVMYFSGLLEHVDRMIQLLTATKDEL